MVDKLMENEMWEVLLQHCQLNLEKNIKRVFYGYSEGNIHFAPTYKVKNKTDTYNNSKRSQAWTDRIFFRSNDGILKLMNYDSNNLVKLSDHRPVFS